LDRISPEIGVLSDIEETRPLAAKKARSQNTKNLSRRLIGEINAKL